MASLPRASELLSDFLDALTAERGVALDRRPLSRWNTLGAGLCALSSRTNKVAVDQFDANVLARARGSALDDYCESRSQGIVKRFLPTKARGYVTFERLTAGAGAGTIVAGTEVRAPNPADGRSYVYVVQADTSIGATALNVSPDAEAQLAGAGASIGLATAGVTLTGAPAALFDATLRATVVNVTGGVDQEKDEELRARMEMFLLGRKGAIFAAVAYAALAVNGVKHVVLADMNDPHLGARGVMYVGDANWQSNDALQGDVAQALESWRAMGGALSVRPISQTDVPVEAAIVMARPIALYNASAIKNAGIQAILDYFDNRIDPYTYNPTSLSGRIERVHEEVAKIRLVTPVAEVTNPLAPSQVKLNGFFPATLVRYRTRKPIITLSVESPV